MPIRMVTTSFKQSMKTKIRIMKLTSSTSLTSPRSITQVNFTCLFKVLNH